MTLLVRSSSDPKALIGAIRNEIWSVDRDEPVADVKSMEDYVSESLAWRRFTMALLAVFASLALILAAVGIYGVMAYSMAQRTHEIGIRMALGARSVDVLKLVVGQISALALIGVSLGLAGALALTRVISGLLYGVSQTDPVTLIAVSILLAAVALGAGYIPARRATRVDPTDLLRTG